MHPDALSRFRELVARAEKSALSEPLAMTLATVGADGQPAARIVLLRGFDERGFVFYTNTNSRKGDHINQNPRVALCFYWDELGEQVRIEGVAKQVGDDDADRYWQGRPRESRIGAWASDQSEILDDRGTLEARVAKYEAEFDNRDVPRPRHWGGYRVTPERIEFWTRGAARLHQRTVYQRTDAQWTKLLLYP